MWQCPPLRTLCLCSHDIAACGQDSAQFSHSHSLRIFNSFWNSMLVRAGGKGCSECEGRCSPRAGGLCWWDLLSPRWTMPRISCPWVGSDWWSRGWTAARPQWRNMLPSSWELPCPGETCPQLGSGPLFASLGLFLIAETESCVVTYHKTVLSPA